MGRVRCAWWWKTSSPGGRAGLVSRAREWELSRQKRTLLIQVFISLQRLRHFKKKLTPAEVPAHKQHKKFFMLPFW